MRKGIFCLLLTLLFCWAAGCSDSDVIDGIKREHYMFYVDESEKKVVAEAYEPVSENTADMVQEFINNQTEDPGTMEKDEHPILPKGVNIEEAVLDGQLLKLDLSGAYSDIKYTREIVARVGLVRTFAQIPGVMSVQILVEGQPLKDTQGNDIPALKNDSFVENSGKEINTYQNITMTLYFTNADGTKLVPEKRNVNYSSNVPLERFVVEQLIKGPKEDGHYATLPAEMNILSVTISDGICYVNFDDSFQMSTLSISEEIPIYSIVNSLVSVCKVQEVQFSINGESKVTFRDKVPLDQLFKWDDSYLLGGEKKE